MELKNYQKAVIKDLTRFLNLLTEKQSISRAYSQLWEEKGVCLGPLGMPFYNASLQGVPHVCLKVPTGGGKTFLAANAIKPIFEAMPHIHPKAVVWLVPSDAIMQQTITNLTNVEHPYRQKIDVDFGGKVEVYTKEQLLNGQNFNPVSVDENLSIFVLTYDSFRTNKKDGRKAYQQNGNLTAFNGFKGDTGMLLEDVDDTALIQVIRQLNPVAIVDESHHATSKLSIEMLENFNPCFVLDLTATPKEGSNIISYVDARQLKKEEMVKLPVIVYNMKSQEDVYLSAITLRKRLEIKARKNEQETGKYIRPIVLLQAQPRTSEDSATYEKIKTTLIEIGVPEEEIAIKTGDRDDIKTENLLSRDCKIRYIITVNALKEGWDCPFAYILATVANRNSTVDVEQILGRVLRLPYTKMSKEQELNLSYAITSSADFYGTLDKVVKGLNNAGFSKRDYMVKDLDNPAVKETDEIEPEQMELPNLQPSLETDLSDTEPVDVNTDELKKQLETVLNDEYETEGTTNQANEIVDTMIETALTENTVYWENITSEENEQYDDIPDEVVSKMKMYHVRKEFEDDLKELRLPQFVVEGDASLFSEHEYELLDRENLRKGFTLRDKDTEIDFDSIEAEIAKVDVDDAHEAPKAWKFKGFESEAIKEWFDSRPTATKRNLCKDRICTRLSKNNAVDDREIRDYVGKIMEQMSEAQLTDLEQNTELYAEKIKKKVDDLLAEHEAKMFRKWVETDIVQCQPMYQMKESISPTTSISSIPKSLYEEEDGDLNDYEKKVVYELASLDNVKWWHRNISRKGFAINGAVTAYPDLMVMLTDGKILMIETKGDHLDNPESKAKAATGSEWASQAGRLYKYYMVFQSKDPGYAGAYSYDKFMEIVKQL
ncbi:DEAD/DEAH box helicase [Lachnoclostridium sp. Marseille-P6806]|uniref:DEAD/DEAH box helicase n=1 Tax=Lachnoclostridium sp. Marseille-P6806 TaxID=2364793 RepID=UPI0010309643|nr:DEAD/DEAH box helicase family protein [Lachnoclostridium sp. Marseille-P6806]